MTTAEHREVITAQVIEWALRDKPFETAYLQQTVPATIDRNACEAVLKTLEADRWIRLIGDAWYPGVRAILLRSFDFQTPDTDGCVRVVGTARDHITANDGARRPAVEKTLTPLEEYMVGINGPNMLRVGAENEYQSWLWRVVVEPGLRTLPEIEPPQADREPWNVGEIDASYAVLRNR